MANLTRIAFPSKYFAELADEFGDSFFEHSENAFYGFSWVGRCSADSMSILLETCCGMLIELHMYHDNDDNMDYPCIHTIKNFGDLVRLVPLRQYGACDIHEGREHVIYNRTHDKLVRYASVDMFSSFVRRTCEHIVELEQNRCMRINDFSNEYKNMKTLWETNSKPDVVDSNVSMLALCGDARLAQLDSVRELDKLSSRDGKIGITCNGMQINTVSYFVYSQLTVAELYTRSEYRHATSWWPLTVSCRIILDGDNDVKQMYSTADSERMPRCILRACSRCETEPRTNIISNDGWMLVKSITTEPQTIVTAELSEGDAQFVNTRNVNNANQPLDITSLVEQVRIKMQSVIDKYERFVDKTVELGLLFVNVR